jgi:hypothetical protein
MNMGRGDFFGRPIILHISSSKYEVLSIWLSANQFSLCVHVNIHISSNVLCKSWKYYGEELGRGAERKRRDMAR